MVTVCVVNLRERQCRVVDHFFLILCRAYAGTTTSFRTTIGIAGTSRT